MKDKPLHIEIEATDGQEWDGELSEKDIDFFARMFLDYEKTGTL